MTKRQRLDAVIAGKRPDRPPVLGGWIANPRAIVEITGAKPEDYDANPLDLTIEAYKILDMDGLIAVFHTYSVDEYRFVTKESYAKADRGSSFEETVAAVESLPEADEYEKRFNFEAEYAKYKKHLLEIQAKCDDIVYMPANWYAGAQASWYGAYGYENFFLLIGLRPDLAAKLFRIGGANGHCQSRLVARAIEEGIFPKALFLGEDICTQRGAMMSPKFLREHYAPALAYGLEPLLEAGCKPVWHCDGDVRELMPMLLECGVQGFQGFQPECGMHVEEIVKLRTREGEKLLIFGPFAVTTELPVMTPSQIRKKARYYADLCKDEADLIFFTSSSINPDVPVQNILAMYEGIRSIEY